MAAKEKRLINLILKQIYKNLWIFWKSRKVVSRGASRLSPLGAVLVARKEASVIRAPSPALDGLACSPPFGLPPLLDSSP